MGMRKEMRLRLALPVHVSAENAGGEFFEQDCLTVDLTGSGLRVEGLMQTFRRGAVINVGYGAKSVPTRVMWARKIGAETQSNAGLQVLGGWKNIWGREIPHIPGDDFSVPQTKTGSSLTPSLRLPGDVLSRDAKQEPRVQYVGFLPKIGLLHRVLREPRRKLQLAVRVCGMSVAGRPFLENVITENVSRDGACLIGLTCESRRDEVLILSHQNRSGRFRVTWSRKDSNQPVFQVGLRALALAQNIWGIDFSGSMEDEPAEQRVAQRYICNGGVSIRPLNSKRLVRGTVHDFSLDGCYVEAATPLNVHDKVVLILSIHGTEIRTAAEVQTSHPGMGIGLKFGDMMETDRFALQTLISRLDCCGSVPIDAPGEAKPTKEASGIIEEPEVFQRVFEEWRNRYRIDP